MVLNCDFAKKQSRYALKRCAGKRNKMCVATSGKVIAVNGTLADVDFQGNIIHAEAGLVKIQPGDYVLVHAGCIIQKLTKQDNDTMTELFAELEEAARG